jgi:hypothetical protein
LDQIIENVLNELGDINSVYLTGDLSKGIDSPVVDLLIIGDVNKDYLLKLIDRAEQLIHKKIRYITYSEHELQSFNGELLKSHYLLIYTR